MYTHINVVQNYTPLYTTCPFFQLELIYLIPFVYQQKAWYDQRDFN